MLTWFDYLVAGVLILMNLLTGLNFWRSFRGSVTGRDAEGEEAELWQEIMIRLAAENRQLNQRYTRLESDYNAALSHAQTLTDKLTRRTQALQNCRELLANQQGIEDSSP